MSGYPPIFVVDDEVVWLFWVAAAGTVPAAVTVPHELLRQR